MRFHRQPVFVAALVLTLSGCALLPTSAPSALPPTVAPTLAVTPTPEPASPQPRAQETGFERPVAVFDGDCGAVLTDDEASAAAGSPLVHGDRPSGNGPGVFARTFFVPQAGGVTCWWGSAKSTLYVVALPADSVSVSESSACDKGDRSFGFTTCDVDVTANGVRFSGYVSAASVSIATMSSRRDAVEAALASSASARPEPAQAVVPADGAWASPADCAAIGSAVDFGAIFGTSLTFRGVNTGGSDAYFAPAEVDLWHGQLPPTCGIFSTDAKHSFYLDFDVIGGGRWAEPLVSSQSSGTQPITVVGADAAYSTIDKNDGQTIDVFDGVNWLQLGRSSDPAVSLKLAAALLAALNS